MAAEKQFETKIKSYLKSKDIWYVKFFANGMTKKGVPDILACINGRFFGIEVKAEDGKASPLQIRNIKEINSCGGIGIIVKPSGFDDLKALIEAELSKDKPA